MKGTSEDLICKRCYAEDSEKHLIGECPMIERKHSTGSKFKGLLNNSASAQNMREIAKLVREYTNDTKNHTH